MPLAEHTKKQILVVEDEGLIAADVQRRLEHLGYSVPAIAQSGEEALRCARSTPFDLVLMDIRIKGKMDGIATAAALKEEFETPVVYLTAHSDQATVDRAKLTEPYGYVLKPVGDGNLRSAVQIAIYKSEMEHRISDAWLADTLHRLGEGLITSNTNGLMVCEEPVAGRLTGGSSANAYGRQLKDVLALLEEPGARVRNPGLDLVPGESGRCVVPTPLLEGIDRLKHSVKALETAIEAIAAECCQAGTFGHKPCAARSRTGR